MNEDIITMLDEQIKAELEGLSNLAVGSKEHTVAIDGLARLYGLRIDDSKAATEYNREIDDYNLKRDKMELEQKQYQEKIELEQAQNQEQAKREEQSRKEQLAEQKKDRYVRIGIAAAEIVVPLVFFAKIYQMGYDLEKEGTFTVQTLKNLIRFIKPSKR